MSEKKKMYVSATLFFCLTVLFSSVAHAHKVRVFAYGEGDTIVGETAFSGGRAAKGAKITVRDAKSDKILSTCLTDDKGSFHFKIPEEAKKKRLDLQIVVNVGEGHRGEWLLEAVDYLEDGASSIQEAVQTVAAPVAKTPVAKLKLADEERVRKVMEEVLDKKLAPIKHMLSKSEDRGPTLQDILGGIGYLLGLAGIAAYMKSKKKE